MMSHAGSSEIGAGAFSLHEPSQKTLPRLRRTSRPLVLVTLFADALVDFDFEPLLLVMTQISWTDSRRRVGASPF
jgi:hypothetical protein